MKTLLVKLRAAAHGTQHLGPIELTVLGMAVFTGIIFRLAEIGSAMLRRLLRYGTYAVVIYAALKVVGLSLPGAWTYSWSCL